MDSRLQLRDICALKNGSFKKIFFYLKSNVSTLAFKKDESSDIIENRVEREGQLEDYCSWEKMTKAWASGSGKSKAWKSFHSVIDLLNVAGDKKEGISDNPELSSAGD